MIAGLGVESRRLFCCPVYARLNGILHRRLLAIVRDDEMCRHMARERAQSILRLAGRRRDRVPLALVAEMQERHEHKREGGEGRR
jgi:hypothetical protein